MWVVTINKEILINTLLPLPYRSLEVEENILRYINYYLFNLLPKSIVSVAYHWFSIIIDFIRR